MTPEQAVPSPGQAAYEVKCAAVRKRRGREFFMLDWADLPPGDRDEWEAAAKAVAPALTGLLAGARQLRDEAMDEAENLREERDRLTERVAELVTEGNELREELGKVRNALGMLASIVHANVLVMEAAGIEMRRGDTHAAMQWILNAMADQWDGEPGTEWNGRETAQEWFDRQPAVQHEHAAATAVRGES